MEPVKVVGNMTKAKRLLFMIAGKNLSFTNVADWEQGTMTGTTGLPTASTTRLRMKNRLRPIALGTATATVSVAAGYLANFWEWDTAGNFLKWTNVFAQSQTITLQATTAFVTTVVKRVDDAELLPAEIALAQPQIEVGSTATAFEPYVGD
jgi:hypothetical protein